MTQARQKKMKIQQRWLEELADLSNLADEKIDLADTALLLSAYTLVLDDIDEYRDTLKDHAQELQKRVDERTLKAEDNTHPLDIGVAALRDLFGTQLNYQGDVEDYDNLSNALMTSVMDRRKGLPVSLGILFISAARAVGWMMEGLHFPGHFLVRLEIAGRRRIIDPFAGGMPVEAVHMRALLKGVEGSHAELEPAFYQPASNRDILLRLQNNLKTRLLKAEEFGQALEILETSMLFCPEQASLWYESGLLKSRLGRVHGAIADFNHYREHCADGPTQRKVEALVAELRQQLQP